MSIVVLSGGKTTRVPQKSPMEALRLLWPSPAALFFRLLLTVDVVSTDEGDGEEGMAKCT